MKILTIGDVVAPATVEYMRSKLWGIRKSAGVDFVVCNGENASNGNGLAPAEAEGLFDAGVDVITGGNHIFRKNAIYGMLDNDSRIIRPANLPARMPGIGYTIINSSGYKFLVINLAGRMFMDAADCLFDAGDSILNREKGNYDIAILDIHAEATSEKCALARYFDGRISAIFGTHTHVATADEQVLPGGSGYITDLGFSGVQNSVLGVKSEIIIEKFKNPVPVRFDFAEGEITINGAVFDIDENNGKCREVVRIQF